MYYIYAIWVILLICFVVGFAMQYISIKVRWKKTKSMLSRREGVYCHWESYPLHSGLINNILVIERVNGDDTVSTFSCASDEARTIAEFLRNEGIR